jgi:hypothetical protein
LDHYLFTANPAASLLGPKLVRVQLAQPQPGVTPETLAGREHPWIWYTAEEQVLLAAVRWTAKEGPGLQTWRLTNAVCGLPGSRPRRTGQTCPGRRTYQLESKGGGRG